MANGLFLVVLVPWFDVVLGMPAEWWSVAVAIIGGSGLVAALVAARLGERLPPHRLIVIGAIAPTLGTLMLVGTPSSPRIVAGFVLIGCMVMIGIGGATLVQRRVASSHQGRINSLSVCSMQGSQLVGVLLAGALIDSIGPAVAMYVMIAGFCTASMLELFVARAARVAPTTFSEEQLAISA